MSDREDSPDEKPYRSSKKSPVSKGSRSRSRSRSPSVSKSRKRSRSHGRSSRHYSRSRSRSPRRRRSRHSRSRSRSYSPAYSRRHRDSRSYRHRSRSHSPMSSRRRHASNREHPETSKCVGVFGLSLYTQERDLRECFNRYGPMEDVQVVYDHQTGRSRGFAFIYFRNLEDAEEAKERAAGTEIDGRKIRVDYSITQRAHTPTPGIYLGKPTSSGYRSSRRSASPSSRRHGYSRSRSRSRSYSPRRY